MSRQPRPENPRSTVARLLRFGSLLIFLASVGFGLQVPAMAQVSKTGQWQTLPYTTPINPVHLALLRTGKVLIVSGSGNYPPNTDYESGVLDPVAGTITTQPLSWDMFCNGMIALPDGRIFVMGGNLQYDPFFGQLKTAAFDPATGQFNDLQAMAHGRWYPTPTVLSDGSVMVFSGLTESGATNSAVEIYNVGSGWSQQYTAPWNPPLYPRMHLLPNGTVFNSGPSTESNIFDPVSKTWQMDIASTNFGISRTYGSSVLLPLTPANNYKPRVFLLGGGSPATNTTEVIDLSASSPQWVWGPAMTQPRIEMNATLLPNGTILAVGGSTNDEDLNTASMSADLFNVNSQTITVSSAGANSFPRLYHSVELLLPDATVLIAGGNPSRGTYEPRMEIYSPPYLFNSDGTLASRPSITSVTPGEIGYASTFQLSTPNAASISSVVLMRDGSVTHAFDMEQRMVGLNFTVQGTTLTVTSPPNGNIAPPGYYMLFVLNSAGVPSVAKFVQLSLSPNHTPPTGTIISPATNITVGLNQSLNFSGTATDPGGTVTSYSWVFPGGNPSVSNSSTPGAVVFSALGSFNTSLTVTDNFGLTDPSPETRTITVVPAFSLSVSPTSQVISAGGNGNYTLVTTSDSGFTGTVTFSASGLPPGVTVTFNPPTATSGSSNVGVSVGPGVSNGTYPFTISGTSGGLTETTSATLIVSPITIQPPNATLLQGQTQQFTATIQNTGNQSVTWSISPPLGSVSTTGLYTTPVNILSSQQVTLTATGVADPSKSATAIINLTPSPLVPPSGLALYWTFDTPDDAGGTAQDKSGNNGNGTIVGSPVQIVGKLNEALSFNGASTSVTMNPADGATAFNNSVTVAAWIKTTATSVEGIISKYNAAGYGWGYLLRTNASGTVELLLGWGDVASGPGLATDTTKINDGQWHHVAAVLTLGVGVTFYIDGNYSSATATNITAGGDNGSSLVVGVNPYTGFGNYFNGSVDEVRIYNRALNATEVNTVYQISGATPSAVLTSIAVTPATPSLPLGATQPLTATGIYQAGNTQNLTSQVSWSSATPAVATISSAGVVTAVATGSSTVTATLNGVTGSTVVTVPTATSITVTPTNPSLAPGGTQALTATANFFEGLTQNVTSQVVWNSGTPSVATVTSSGVVTGVATGTSTITATLNGVTGSTVVTVSAPSSITVTPANPTVVPGGTQALTATANYSGGGTQNVTGQVVWSSGTPSVATVGSSGVVTGVGTGTSTITATLNGVAGSTVVTVSAPSSITVTPANPTVVPGGTQALTATANYSGGGTQNVTGPGDVEFRDAECGHGQRQRRGNRSCGRNEHDHGDPERRRGKHGCDGFGAQLDHRDASESDRSPGRDSGADGDGELFWWRDAECHGPGDVELGNTNCRDREQQWSSNRSGRRDEHDHGNPERGSGKHGCDCFGADLDYGDTSQPDPGTRSDADNDGNGELSWRRNAEPDIAGSVELGDAERGDGWQQRRADSGCGRDEHDQGNPERGSGEHGCNCSRAQFHHGDASQSKRECRQRVTVYGDRDLCRRGHANHHESGNLEFGDSQCSDSE